MAYPSESPDTRVDIFKDIKSDSSPMHPDVEMRDSGLRLNHANIWYS